MKKEEIKIAYYVMHHEDDGTEAEYWAVVDDSDVADLVKNFLMKE